MKQNLVRATLAKQTLEIEKKELLRRVEDLEKALSAVKGDIGGKDPTIKAQLEDFIKKHQGPDGSMVSAAGPSIYRTRY
jgi:hypothetical protein